MSNYRPPYGALSLLLSSSRQEKKMEAANRRYKAGYHRGKGLKHGSR